MDTTHTTTAAIGARLHAWRKGRGWSLARAAEATGSHPHVVQGWERGTRRPQLEHLVALACEGLSLDWLITGHGHMETEL